MPDGMDALSRRAFGRTLGAVAAAGVLRAHPAEPSAGQGSGAGDELYYRSATELAAAVRRKQISARDVLRAHLSQIERTNPKVNAIVTLVAEQALAAAARADEMQARGSDLGILHGLPVAHKDLVDTAGIRTTRGSPFFRDNVPARDALIVRRIRDAGAITIGKTNTP
jgi:amidase